jgi:hypothetical protein
VAAVIDAIDVKRKMFFEVENTPFLCLEAGGFHPYGTGRPDLGPTEDAQPSHKCGL